MPEEQRPRRKSTRLGDAARRPPARAASAKNSNTPKALGDWFWLAIGSGSVVLAGLLFALIYNWSSPDAEPTNVAAVDAPVVPAETSKNSAAAQDSSQRAIALRILSLGGRVTVKASGGETQEVYNSEALPSGDFSIDAVSLDGIETATDDEVAPLTELQAMRELGLSKTKVTDAGLKDLPRATALSSVNLRGCAITDQGLQSLGQMKGLKMLIADGGMSGISTVRDFGPQSNASAIEPQPAATGTAFTDDGLRSLSGLKGLETLSLISRHAGDSGLASITNASQKLMQLRTVGFEITDDGVSSLKNLSNLRVLELSNSLITNNCIDTLCQLKKLEYLIVQGTQITPDGVKQLQQRLPKCRVFGGKYDSRLNIIREIMVLGGKVTIIPEGQPPQDLVRFEDLPEKFTVQSIDLTGVKSLKLEDLVLSEATSLILTDSGVESFDLVRLPKWMPKLKHLDLTRTAVTDRECAFLVDLKDLTSIDFSRSPVTRAGAYIVARGLFNCDVLYGLPTPKADHEVAELVLKLGAQITIEEPGKKDVTISDPAELPASDFKLRYVSMTLPRLLTDEVAAKFAGLRHLRGLGAAGCMMTDAGLVHFENMMNFRGMDIHHSPGPITDIGMRSLGRPPKGWSMHLESLQITDEGIRNLGHQPHLISLHIGFNKITDKRLQAIADQFEGLFGLSVNRSGITDEGVAFLASGKLAQLNGLGLLGCKIGDPSLQHITKISTLTRLDLSGTQVTDAGMQTLTALPNLAYIDINETRVTAKGIATLREKFPKIVIPDDYRTAALKKAFQYGAKLTVILKNQKREEIDAFDKLPSNSLLVHRMDFTGNEAINGGYYVYALGYCNLTEIRELRLTKPMVEHSNLAVITGNFKDLVVLDLSQTDAIDGHLELLANMQSLRRLDLTGTRCTKQGIAALKAALPQCEIIGP